MRTLSTYVVVLIAACPWLAACSPPTTPSSDGILVSGPRDIAPGATAQFRAVLRSGGQTRDVTEAASWFTPAPSVLDVSAGGIVSARAMGEATVRARYQGADGQHQVFVVPPGTFRLTGTVSEAGAPSLLVVGALVEATSGTGAIVSARTNPSGSYTLFGVSGAVQLRVTMNGYHDWETTVTATDHARHDIALPALLPRAAITGTFRLTIAASAACAGNLPEEARRRSYTGVIAPTSGAFLQMMLQGNFFQSQISHNIAEVSREGDRLRISLYRFLDTDPPYPGITEWLTQTPPVLYEPVGTAWLNLVDGAFVGTMNGSISVQQHPHAWDAVPLAACQAPDHEFVLRR